MSSGVIITRFVGVEGGGERGVGVIILGAQCPTKTVGMGVSVHHYPQSLADKTKTGNLVKQVNTEQIGFQCVHNCGQQIEF